MQYFCVYSRKNSFSVAIFILTKTFFKIALQSMKYFPATTENRYSIDCEICENVNVIILFRVLGINTLEVNFLIKKKCKKSEKIYTSNLLNFPTISLFLGIHFSMLGRKLLAMKRALFGMAIGFIGFAGFLAVSNQNSAKLPIVNSK